MRKQPGVVAGCRGEANLREAGTGILVPNAGEVWSIDGPVA